MDLLDHIWSCDDQQVVIALELMLVLGIPLSSVVIFNQLVPLDHGAHRPVNVQDALLHELLQMSKGF